MAISSIIAVASQVVPRLLDILFTEKDKDKYDEIAKSIEETVKSILGTDDPEQARKELTENQAKSDALRIALKKIEAEQELKRHEHELEQQKLAQAESQQKSEHELSLLRMQMEERQAEQSQQFEELKVNLADVGAARSSFRQLVADNSPAMWAPVAVSIIIIIGFFVTLGIILADLYNPTTGSGTGEIVYILIGTLTAGFSTVVSFWLGSSQGSRQKDGVNFEIQNKQTEILRDAQRRTPATSPNAPQSSGTEPPTSAKTETKFANESNFDECVALILEHEGGYVDDPDDPGGATNRGITFATLQRWRGAEKITKQDVKDLTEEEAKKIYKADYWNAMRCQDLPVGVDLVVFDFGVNAGPSRSAKILQKVVGAAQDGMIGPITIAAVKAVEPAHIIRRFSELRIAYYKSLSHFQKYGKGWTNRTQRTEIVAMGMVQKKKS